MGLFERLKSGLAKTRDSLALAAGFGATLDATTQAELEAALLQSDLGTALCSRVLEEIRRGDKAGVRERLAEALIKMVPASAVAIYGAAPLAQPEVVLMVGVNGSGKTTSCGKLAWHWVRSGQKVLLGGADTFRAAAVEQLKIWASRSGADFFSQGQDADPAAVTFDAVSKAKAGLYDRLIIDTAGRLQTKSNLMEELRKVHRVCSKAMPGAPHRVILVLDGTAGQNMLSQARLFHEAVPLNGLIVTKLDGSSKAGAVLAVMDELKIPVQLIGVGEGTEDLQEFNAEAFVRAMVG
jgi:fused signal recognition particle receptor